MIAVSLAAERSILMAGRPAAAWAARRTFSSTVRERSKFVRWNEQPTPRRVMRHAGWPLTSTPSRWMVPELGGKCPDSRLTSVDLPAPLGPMMACSSPRCRRKDTFLTAARPPKLRPRPLVASSGSDVVRGSAMRRALRSWFGRCFFRGCRLQGWPFSRQSQTAQSLRQCENDEQDHQTLDEQLTLRDDLSQFLQPRIGERAQNGAVQGIQPAEQNHQQRLCG